MRDEIVRRFLATIPEHVHDGLAAEAPAAARWRHAAEVLAIPCPPELAVLGEEQDRRAIFAGAWELFDPDGALREHASLAALARTMPCLTPHARMLPLFSADGELLLLGRDGAIRRCSLTSGALPYDHGIVVPSLAALLEAFVEGRPRPGLSSWYEPHGSGWLWVDEREYHVSIGHHHEERDGHWTCITTLVGDLAPHYFRWPDGPDRPPLDGHRERARAPFTVELVGDPAVVPRVEPVGILENGERRIDLGEERERFVRLARSRGWTGRDGKRLVIDGWEALGLSPPTRVEAL